MYLIQALHLPPGLDIITQIVYAIEWSLRLLALFVVPRNRKPASGMAWLLVIFLAPIPGWLLFLILGTSKLPKGRQEIQNELDRMIDYQLDKVTRRSGNPEAAIEHSIDPKYHSVARLATALGHLPVSSSNEVTVISNYDKVFSMIVEDIKAATSTIYVEYFTIVDDETTRPLLQALRDATARGVKVFVLYDFVGSHKYRKFRAVKKILKANGIQHHAMLPFHLPGKAYVRPDLRNHRKLVVIDHTIGYVGSQNLIDRAYHRRDNIVYEELVVRLTGRIARQLSAVFASDWLSETDHPLDTPSESIPVIAGKTPNSLLQLLPSGPGYADENNLKVFTHLMYTAEKSITIVNPYFVPTEPLITAIVSAARRGVKVRMLNSQVRDQLVVAHAQRSYYETLLTAGVEIYLHNKPVLVHSKFIIIDDEISVVGSSNLDIRSFELDHELTLIAYDQPTTDSLVRVAQVYFKHAVKIDPIKWQARRPIVRLLDNLARLTSALQ